MIADFTSSTICFNSGLRLWDNLPMDPGPTRQSKQEQTLLWVLWFVLLSAGFALPVVGFVYASQRRMWQPISWGLIGLGAAAIIGALCTFLVMARRGYVKVYQATGSGHTLGWPSSREIAQPYGLPSNFGGPGPVRSAPDLLASGQRASGALKSFAATGMTPRSLGRTPSRPELIDAPYYQLEVELHLPNLAPVIGRSLSPVPPAQVPNLSIGLQLPCIVDQANTAHFVVDWDAIAD
jgi:hypothetical protein